MDFNSRPNSADSFSRGNTNNTNNENSNQFYHYGDQRGQQMQTNEEMLRNYYKKWYSDYYQHVWRQQRAQHFAQQHALQTKQLSPQLRAPLKYGSRGTHARAVFSQHDNRLIVLENACSGRDASRALTVYSLSDLFVDHLCPHLSPILQKENIENGIPFLSRDACLQWIRMKGEMDLNSNFENKLIVRIIQTLLKQNGIFSGLDLSELLMDLCDWSALSRDSPSLNTFRSLLMRGQKTVALNHALNPQNGLLDHALCLSFLLDANKRSADHVTTETLTLTAIKRFCDTLSADDPLAVLYLSLLNSVQKKRIFLDLSFESFLMLLSNELDLNCVSIRGHDQQPDAFPNLLALIKSLMAAKTDFLLNEELFPKVLNANLVFDSSRIDCLLVNECLEFGLLAGKEFNARLIDRKLVFAALLFDFGFAANALQYCRQLKTFGDALTSSARRLINQLETRFDSSVVFTEEDVVDDTQTTPDDSNQSFIDQNVNQSYETTPDDSPVEDTPSEPVVPIVPVPPIAGNTSFDYYGQLVPPVVTNSALNSAVPLNTSVYQNNQFSPPPVDTRTQPEAPPMVANGDLNASTFDFISSANSNLRFDFQTTDDDRQTTLRDDTQNDRSFTTFANNSVPVPSRDSNGLSTGNESRDESIKGGNESTKSSGLLSRFFNLRPKNQAILPDDSNPTLVFDERTKQWIDKSQPIGEPSSASSALSSPPIGPPVANGVPPSGPKKFEFRSSRRYVDITRKQ